MANGDKKDVIRERPLPQGYSTNSVFPKQCYTYADYLTWDDEKRYEIIGGKVYDMSPAPLRRHQGILGALFVEFANYLKGKDCKVYIAPFDVRIPEIEEHDDEEISNVVQPDLSVYCDKDKLDERGSKGRPDLVIEVISPSTLKKDMTVKKALYEKAGVREYWLVYPSEEVILVHILNQQGQYEEMKSYSKEDSIHVRIFEDFSIELKAIFEA